MEPHEDPADDYERMLERAGLDCSTYGCWKPINAIVLNRHGAEVGACAEHAKQHAVIVRWLES